jgi:hypothetical protein
VAICSHCHPFFTGVLRPPATEGRIARFRRRYRQPGDGAAEIVRVIALVVCLMATADSAWAGGPPRLRLCLVNPGGAADDSLAVARREVRDIWATAGLAVVWLEPMAGFDPADGPTVTVILRRDFLPRAGDAAASSPHRSGPLAWSLFIEGVPTDLIEVSLSAVTALVMSASFAGRRMADLPPFWRRRLLGRALGRVLAHEIGHRLGGASHQSDGLMKAGLTGVELVERPIPALPVAWVRDGASQLLTASAHRVSGAELARP